MKRTAVLLILSSMIFLARPLMGDTNHNISTVTIDIRNKEFILEKAKTPFAQMQGLMHRKHMAENRGMLFIYDFPKTATFWMGHTLIPLDLIMIDADYTITDIFSLEPQPHKRKNESAKEYSDRMPKYTSSEKILYAIEINQGLAQKLKLKKGDRIAIPENL